MSDKALTRGEIFKPVQFRRERVNVPQWGGHVYVRQISAKDFEEWQDWIAKQETAKAQGKAYNPQSHRAALIVQCVCDENGRPIFEAEQADIAALGGHLNGTIDLLYEACKRLNLVEATALEDAEKNS